MPETVIDMKTKILALAILVALLVVGMYIGSLQQGASSVQPAYHPQTPSQQASGTQAPLSASVRTSPIDFIVGSVTKQGIVGQATYLFADEKGDLKQMTKEVTLIIDSSTSIPAGYSLSKLKPKDRLFAVITKESPEESSIVHVLKFTPANPNTETLPPPPAPPQTQAQKP